MCTSDFLLRMETVSQFPGEATDRPANRPEKERKCRDSASTPLESPLKGLFMDFSRCFIGGHGYGLDFGFSLVLFWSRTYLTG